MSLVETCAQYVLGNENTKFRPIACLISIFSSAGPVFRRSSFRKMAISRPESKLFWPETSSFPTSTKNKCRSHICSTMVLVYHPLLYVAILQVIVDALEPMQLAAGDEIIKQGDMVRVIMEKFKGRQLKRLMNSN